MSASQQPPMKKRKVTSKDDVVDEYIIQSLRSIEERWAQRQVGHEDEDEHFGRQIAATLRRLPSRQKAMAKLHMQQVLVDAEFSEEPQSTNDSYYVGY